MSAVGHNVADAIFHFLLEVVRGITQKYFAIYLESFQSYCKLKV